MSKYFTKHRKEVIKFAWNHLKAHDLTSKLWAYVNSTIHHRVLFYKCMSHSYELMKWTPGFSSARHSTSSYRPYQAACRRTSSSRLLNGPRKLRTKKVIYSDHTATTVYVEFLAEIWVINRSGLDLVYGTAADSEAYIPPPAPRTRVGNAQISAYSSDNSGKIPVIRTGLRGCSWSARFQADPKRLSWQDECITPRSAGNTASSDCVLYELGVSADYATRHFGSVTLVSVIPRYMILNRSQRTLLLLETSHRQLQRPEASSNDNVAHHVLGPGAMYALYWVCEPRALLRTSVLTNKEASDSICEEGYDWSEAFAVDRAGTTDLLVPPRASGRCAHLEVVVKRVSLSQATFLLVVSELSANSPASPPLGLLAAASLISSSTKNVVAERGWQTFSFHDQMTGVIITITDTNTEE
ncbi:hypothetical protein PsorP6_013697 [Peronosclerospora sorghi]|uniref:Uncharacterized protein n=1 Tax=Peronosclerospora sorghi TaxID=230839 RepID=A0ACC0VIN1_9STRA|nr:hypothetical protein PsorP6_013697 [Peronosclerospora sorghi]